MATLLLTAVLVAVVLTAAVAVLTIRQRHLIREVRQLQAELKVVRQADSIIARAQRRRHLVAVPAVWVAKEVKEHPIVTAAAVGVIGAAGLFAVAQQPDTRERRASGMPSTTTDRTSSTTTTTLRTTTTGVRLGAVPPAPEPGGTGVGDPSANDEPTPVSVRTTGPPGAVTALPSEPPAEGTDGSPDVTESGSPQPDSPSGGPSTTSSASTTTTTATTPEATGEARVCPLLGLELLDVGELCL